MVWLTRRSLSDGGRARRDAHDSDVQREEGSKPTKASFVPSFFSHVGTSLTPIKFLPVGSGTQSMNQQEMLSLSLLLECLNFQLRLGQNVKVPLLTLQMSIELLPQMSPGWNMVNELGFHTPPTSCLKIP